VTTELVGAAWGVAAFFRNAHQRLPWRTSAFSERFIW